MGPMGPHGTTWAPMGPMGPCDGIKAIAMAVAMAIASYSYSYSFCYTDIAIAIAKLGGTLEDFMSSPERTKRRLNKLFQGSRPGGKSRMVGERFSFPVAGWTVF